MLRFTGSTASSLKHLVPSLDADAIAKASVQLKEFLDNEEDGDTCLARFVPSSAFRSIFAKLDWVPTALKDKRILPENLHSFGTPWLLRNAPACARFGTDVWPTIGCGGFLMSLDGKAFLVAWPMSWTASVNVSYEES